MIPPEAVPHNVTSSNIKKIGYLPAVRKLYVEFNDNSIYSYEGVPIETYNALLTAASVGKFFASEIRPKYQANKES